MGIELVDDAGAVLPHDGATAGRLLIRGPTIARAYYGEAEEAVDAEGWFDTGDVAVIDAAGYMRITDRAKDIVKSGGEWISSIEIENLATAHPSVAIAAVASVRSVLAMTLAYVKERKAFGQPVGSFQNSRFVLAEIATELDLAQHYVDDCVRALNVEDLTAVDAAKAKWWTTELQGRAVDRCLQLHGGYGFMNEYPIARRYADARVTRIYGGTTEIMKTVISKSIGL